MASQKRFNFGRAGTLFNRKTIKREFTKVVFEPTDQQLKAAKNWAAQVRHPNFDKAKETAVRGEFIQTVLVTLLGYTPYRAGETFTVATEEALGKGAVDTALGTFSGGERIILAPFELRPGNMPSMRRARNGCLFRIARKSGSTPSATAGAWENFVGLFEAVDKGNPALDIPAYNGGLFARNTIIDALGLSNFVCENFAKIADYDFSSDVPVSVLGHIFEQSVSDIEKMRAEAQGEEPPKTSKRKRDGVVYTPGFVTRFIVEETIGKTLSERFAAVREANGVVETKSARGIAYNWTPEVERAVWLDYRHEMRGLTIVDPACGSGAFLIAAFDYLAAEYQRVAERLAVLGETVDASEVDREILAGNLHGVDLNPEPVEITKLSLWLKTAKRGKLLQDLEQSIRCGNSLIADKNEHGRAFDWQEEFPEIFASGGFDIVLGNPPYVRMERR